MGKPKDNLSLEERVEWLEFQVEILQSILKKMTGNAELKQVTSKLADAVIPIDAERGVWDYKGNGKWEQTEPKDDECKGKTEPKGGKR